jgi:hypothetical protein
MTLRPDFGGAARASQADRMACYEPRGSTWKARVDYALVSLVAVVVAALTLLSGFGLGTLLMPAFALFFPVPMAIAATAVVHLANNVFKLALVGRQADPGVVLRFALPGAAAAMAGAWLLGLTTGVPPLGTYRLGGQMHEITVLKLVVAAAMVGFALLEALPRVRDLAFDRRYLLLGGVLSGFFGGLTGHQGALRAAFLVKSGLAKEAFVGTSVVSAVLVDVARLAVYGLAFDRTMLDDPRLRGLVLVATAAAFLGSFLGTRLVRKVTLRAIQVVVAALLLLVAAGLATGLV